MVTQKISYFEIIYQSHKRYAFFNVLIFLNIWLIFLVQTSFSWMLVGNDHNLFEAEMFLTNTMITEKSLQRLIFQYVVLHVYIFHFITFLVLEDKIKYLFTVLRSKSMFCEHNFLSLVKNIGSIKKIFP